jgi:hypothetical protein
MKFIQDAIKYIGIIKVLLGVSKEIKEQIEVFEQDGHGAEKKQAIIDILKLAMETAESIVPGLDLPNDKILTYIDKLIEIIVTFNKLVGNFK